MKEKHFNATLLHSGNAIEISVPTPPRSSPSSSKSKIAPLRGKSKMRLFNMKRSKSSLPRIPHDEATAYNERTKPLLRISIPKQDSLSLPGKEDVPVMIPISSTRSYSESPAASAENSPNELIRKISSIDEPPQETFFLLSDFSKSAWDETVASTSAESLSFSFISIMAATVVIHPMLFVTGAATAVWAVGVVHAAEKGYEFFSDGQFKNMFWADSEKEQFEIDIEESKDSDEENLSEEKYSSPRRIMPSDVLTEKNDAKYYEPGSPIPPAPSPLMSPPPQKSFRRHVAPGDAPIIAHFPQLDTEVCTAELPGLNALEFFHVFLSDDAPYNFKDFQETRGDVDIEYGKWKRYNDEQVSFHPHAETASKLPTSSKKERVLTFKTLTKSYFGPAYATAKKTQRVFKFSTRLVIIESKTELFGIPYSDRFFVIEKWIVQSFKHENKENPSMEYTTKLSVSVEVFMLKSCSWEKQIRQKTTSTMTDLLTSWTEKATQVLELTLKRKLERMRLLNDTSDSKSLFSYRSKDSIKTPVHKRFSSSPSLPTLQENGISRQTLMNMHHDRLQLLEKKAAAGDLEWCSVEMKHCINAGKEMAFTKILDSTGILDTDLENQLKRMGLNDHTRGDDRPTEISITTKSRKPKKRGMKKRLIDNLKSSWMKDM